ncbi:MAG TPA: hypothetical protein VGX49_11420, partial [Jatrophihabitans sp.]|nr:hypothetical protein [Jatrophihabitans sp.]
MALGQYAGSVGTQAEEAGVAQRDLPGQAGEEVDALGEDHPDEHEAEDLHRAGPQPVAAQQQHQEQPQLQPWTGHRPGEMGAQSGHALLTSGLPKSPCGRSDRTIRKATKP